MARHLSKVDMASVYLLWVQAELMRRHARGELCVSGQPAWASNNPRPQDSAEYHAPEGLYTAITKDTM